MNCNIPQNHPTTRRHVTYIIPELVQKCWLVFGPISCQIYFWTGLIAVPHRLSSRPTFDMPSHPNILSASMDLMVMDKYQTEVTQDGTIHETSLEQILYGFGHPPTNKRTV